MNQRRHKSSYSEGNAVNNSEKVPGKDPRKCQGRAHDAEESYEKLKSRQIREDELTVNDLIAHRKLDNPIFHGFDITADSNDNMFYITAALLRFVRDKPNQNYLFCSMPFRYDNFELNEQVGLKIIWEDEKRKNEHGLDIAPRFQEGNLKNFLSQSDES